MTNLIANWWRSRQFYVALQSNDIDLATRFLKEIEQSGARLSLLEKTFKDKLEAERRLNDAEKEILVLRQQVIQSPQTPEEYKQEIANLRRQLS